MIVPDQTGAFMIRHSALWAALAVLSLPAPAMAGSATCIWDNLSPASRERSASMYSPDGTISDVAPPPVEEFQRAAGACGREFNLETQQFMVGATGAIAVKSAAAARLKSVASVDETKLEGAWIALTDVQRKIVEDYVIAASSEPPPTQVDPATLIIWALYVMAGWTGDPDDPLLNHYINYYTALATASAYEKLF